MLKKYSISLLLAAAVAIPFTVYALVSWIEKRGKPLPLYGTEQSSPIVFSLKNQNGQTVTQAGWKGKTVVAAFFFTHCPVICPKMTANMKKVKSAFGTDKQPLLTSFSVDPERDSVERLKAFANRFGIGNDWHLLTGNKRAIYQLARKRFAVTATEGDGGQQDFIHSDKLVLLDAQQRIRGYYSGTSEKEIGKLINDIKKLHNEK